MTCVSPCLTCFSTNFYSCTSCDTTINSSFVLSGTQCIVQPTWYIQLTCTCLFTIFIILPLIRKRSLMLTKILDIIQTAAYFKYIKAFIYYRHNLLYLDMRAMNPWNEGWKLLTLSDDLVTPVFLTEETYLNKLLRIASIWIGVILLLLAVGIIRICCRQGKLEFSNFIGKNIKNCLCIAFYLTVQDLAFFTAANFFNPQFGSVLSIIFFSLAVIFTILSFVILLWQSKAINYPYKQHETDKLYNYELMFLYRMDYDLFNTYSLTNLPQKQKKTYRYSNLVLIETVKKIGYAFLIVSFLFKSSATLETQVYSLLGYILIFQAMWYISLPFDPCKQILQLIINITADLILLTILLLPIVVNRSNGDFIYMILCLSLFGLAILSSILQLAMDLYSMIPYDLYDIGLTIVIEDKELKKELQLRNKELEENARKLKQLKEEQERLLAQLEEQKNKPATAKPNPSVKPNTRKPSREMDSQVFINNGKQDQKADPLQQNLQRATKQQDLVYPIDNNTDEGDQLQHYKIDTKKKRLVYNFNKKTPFLYSNKVEQ